MHVSHFVSRMLFSWMQCDSWFDLITYLFCLIGCFCTNWWVKVLLLAFDSSKIIDITIRLRSKVNIDLSHHHYIFLKNDWFYFFVNRFLAYFVEWYANYILFPKWLLCSVSIFQEMTCVLHMQLCMEFILHASLKLWKFTKSKHFELDHSENVFTCWISIQEIAT